MGASISNAGENKWTYYNTFTNNTAHGLPANWNELYIMGMYSTLQIYPTVIVREYLESGRNVFKSSLDQSREMIIEINSTNNTIKFTPDSTQTSWLKIYYR